MMTRIVLTTCLLLGSALRAGAQAAPRFQLEPVVRVDKVYIEGDVKGATAVAGALSTLWIFERFGIEAEMTRAWNRLERSYERHWFYQGPLSNQDFMRLPAGERNDEFNRYSALARRTMRWDAGTGWSAAFVGRGRIAERVDLTARIGITVRNYLETSTYTVLSIPEGVNPVVARRYFTDMEAWSPPRDRAREGLFAGLAVPIAVTSRISVTPELRLVTSGPAEMGDTYRELGLGLRGAWRF